MSGAADEDLASPGQFRTAATLGALGVVYGDIGTSPLYALREAAKAAGDGGAPTPDGVLGVVSLILWALLLIVSAKYAILILRADNRGEGGIVALLALLGARHAAPRSRKAALLIVGLIGAALLYGDGAITPAISVLSAVEGLKLDAPQLEKAVIPLTIVILIGLFYIQHKGTGFVGRIFGPIMLVWFVVIGLLGLRGIMLAPGVLAAVDPLHALRFMLHARPAVSFAILGAAFLAVTGGEAMYADMGHFGRAPIRLAWFVIVLPCLLLNYFGQGALLLVDPGAIQNPFYQLAPAWAHYPLVAFATAATIIASQAIISGAFSLTQQSIQLGFFPFLEVTHTDRTERGQIYVPLVNWLLAIATLSAVLVFGSSDALAGAYGIAVSLLMAITTLLAALVAIQWGYNPLLVAAVNGFFLVIDLVFFGANSLKLFEGGWFPLALAFVVAFLMLTWRRGIALVEVARSTLRQPESDLVAALSQDNCVRLPSTAVFLSASRTGVPLPLTRFVKLNHALHQRVLIVTVETDETPHVHNKDRAEVMDIAHGVTRVILRFGFMDDANVPAGLRTAAELGLIEKREQEEVAYFVGHERLISSASVPGMAVWREALFAFMQANAERSAAYFRVPPSRAIEMGTEIEI